MRIDIETTLNDVIQDNIDIAPHGSLSMSGILSGSVLVEEKGLFKMMGVMNGTLKVVGGHADISGILNGDISIENGSVDVYGIVSGTVPDNGVTPHAGCVINGLKM